MNHRTEYDLRIIGRNLRRLREDRHLTVEQVREYLCLGSVQAVYKYESGTGYPQADTMLALMELYGAGVDDIVGRREEERRSSSDFIKTPDDSQLSGVSRLGRAGRLNVAHFGFRVAKSQRFLSFTPFKGPYES